MNLIQVIIKKRGLFIITVKIDKKYLRETTKEGSVSLCYFAFIS